MLSEAKAGRVGLITNSYGKSPHPAARKRAATLPRFAWEGWVTPRRRG
jgi:hypothetical protein